MMVIRSRVEAILSLSVRLTSRRIGTGRVAHDTKTETESTVLRTMCVSQCAARAIRREVPAASSNHLQRSTAPRPWIDDWVGGVRTVLIVGPFPHVAVHVVQSPRVRRKRADRHRLSLTRRGAFDRFRNIRLCIAERRADGERWVTSNTPSQYEPDSRTRCSASCSSRPTSEGGAPITKAPDAISRRPFRLSAQPIDWTAQTARVARHIRTTRGTNR